MKNKIIPFDHKLIKEDFSNVKLRKTVYKDFKFIDIIVNEDKKYIQIVYQSSPDNFIYTLYRFLDGHLIPNQVSDTDLVLIEEPFDGNFSKLPVGTPVYDIVWGWGKIKRIDSTTYPVVVHFSKSKYPFAYSATGYYNIDQIRPSLYLTEMEAKSK